MELNLTLFVQILNFFIAWFLLRILYFKPAIDFIDCRKKEYDQLIDRLHHWQSIMASKEQEINRLWGGLKQFGQEHKPPVATKGVFQAQYNPSLQVDTIDQKQIDLLVEEIKELIQEGVSHVEL